MLAYYISTSRGYVICPSDVIKNIYIHTAPEGRCLTRSICAASQSAHQENTHIHFFRCALFTSLYILNDKETIFTRTICNFFGPKREKRVYRTPLRLPLLPRYK